MAIALVQQVGGGSSSPPTSITSTATTFTAGNLLVALVWFSTSSTSPTAVSTPSGWTVAGAFQADGGSNGGGCAYYMPNNPGGSQSWTWTKTGGTAIGAVWEIFEFSGVDTTTGLDLVVTKSVTGSSSSTSHNPGAASGTTQAGDLLITVVGASNSSTTITYSASASSAPTSGWTVTTKRISSGSTPLAQASAIYQILAGTQTSPNGFITSSSAVSGGVWFMTFKPGSGTVALSGSVASSSSVTGAISITGGGLAGTIAGASTLSGSLTISTPFYVQDTFVRANVSGSWGTATDGNTWTRAAGAGTLSVTSDEGIIASSSTSNWMTLGSALAQADTDSLVRVVFDATASTTGGIITRFVSTSNGYLCRYSGSGAFQILRLAATDVTIATTPWTPTVGTFYWIRFDVQGSTLQARFWQDGTSEPSTWNLTVTDTTYASAGSAGLYAFGSTATGVQFDSFTVGPLSAPLSGSIDSASSVAGTLTIGGGSLAGAISSASTLAGALTITGVGLAVTTKIQNGISGGPPGNGTTETDVSYVDPSGNGWMAGMIPAYGGALISPWYEIDSGTPSITQTSLGTSTPDGFLHELSQNTGAVYTGTETDTYTFTELAPTGTNMRRYYDSGTMSPSTGPPLQYRVRTLIQPGDPGFLFQRIDITNPSGSSVTLASSDSLEVALIGGLQQVNSVWGTGNGKYATSVGGAESTWPGTLQSANPTYAYCTPASGQGISLTPFCVKETGLVEAAGATSPEVEYLQASGSSGRLKFKIQTNKSSIPGSTTYTLYYLQGFARSAVAGQVNLIAADYLNPDTAATFTDVSDCTVTGYSYDEGTNVFATTTGSGAAFEHSFTSPVTTRWNPCYKVTGWTAGSISGVTIGGTSLTAGSDYLSFVDTTNQIAYVKFLRSIVASGATGSQLNNGIIAIGSASPTVALSGAIDSASSLSATLQVAMPLAGAVASTSALAATLDVAQPLAGAIASASTLSGTPQVGLPLSGAVASSSALAGSLHIAQPLSGAVAATSAVSATLHVAQPVSGSIASTSALTAVLHIAQPLAGAVASTSTLTATPTVHLALAGSVSSASTLTGILSRPMALTGAVASTSTVAGSISTGSSLRGSIASSSSLTGALHIALPLTGAVASTSSLAATLAILQPLFGSVTATSDVAGTLSIRSAFSGDIVSRSALAGALLIALPLAGTASSSSTVRGEVTIAGKVALAGAIISLSALAGSLQPSDAIRTTSVITTLGPTSSVLIATGPTASAVTTLGPTSSQVPGGPPE